jgi:hypothetical protein
MGGGFAFLTTILLGADLVNYDVSLRTEGRTGTPAAGIGSTASFVELVPAAGLSAHLGAFDASAGYTPRLLYGFGGNYGLAVLHRGTLGGAWRMSRKTRFTLDQLVTYGQNNFSPLFATQGQPPPDPHLPPVLTLKYLQSMSTFSVSHSTLTGLEMGSSASYSVSGGADSAARVLLPLQRTAQVNGRFGWELSRTDTLTSILVGSWTSFSNSSRILLMSSGMGWGHRFAPVTRGDFFAGVSLARSARPGVPDRVQAGPNAAADLSHRASRRGQQLEGTVRVALTSAVDPYGGGVYQRVEGILGVEYSPLRSLSLSLRGTGAQGVSGPRELRNGTAQVEFRSLLAVDKHLDLGAGVRTAWVSVGGRAPLQSGFYWAGFVSVTIQQRGKL